MGVSTAIVGRSRGFALIVVLWFLVLISAIGIYMMANARSETALAHNLLAGARAEAVADAAIAQVVFNESDPDPRKHWELDRSPRNLVLPGGAATVSLADETLKINPNLASDALVAALFQSVGVDAAKAALLGTAVADWVAPVDQQHPAEAKRAPYEQAGKNYGPANAPLETIEDLQLVLGMTPQIYAAALPYLTIFTDADAPADLRDAPVPVAEAVTLAARDNGNNDAANQSADNRAAAQPPPVGSAAAPAAPGSPGAPAATAAPTPPPVVLAIDLVAHSADGGIFARHAVIRLDPATAKGYAVLDWRRTDLTQ